MFSASTTYGNVAKTIMHLKDTNPDLTVAPFGLQFPVSNAEIIDAFRAHLHSIPRVAASAANPDPKIVCVVDSIVSNPGIYMPWKEMVKICKEEGVWSVVDAAHSIGQEPGLNMAEVQPDFWFSVRALTRPTFPVCLTVGSRRTATNGSMQSEAVQCYMCPGGMLRCFDDMERTLTAW